MDRELVDAADKGDVNKLHHIIKGNPLMLKAVALCCGDTPLHMACMGGHLHFVKEVLNLRPEFALELNHQGLSPLHIASSNGDVEIVEELLKVGSHDLCLLQGHHNIIPLHNAVVKGRVEVIRVLVSACQDSVTRVTDRGESCLHLAMKNKQFKALKVLCELVVMQEMLNHKDGHGNSILHLAVSTKQYQAVELLLDKNLGYKVEVEVNTLNKKGLTPLDVLLSQSCNDDYDDMGEMLIRAGATTRIVPPPSQNQQVQEQRRDPRKSTYQKFRAFFKYDRLKESPSEARNTLLVIAVLIATATYSAVLSPPGGVWQDDFWPAAISIDDKQLQPPAHTAGKAVMATHTPVCYCVFLLFNSLGLFISLQMMLLLCTLRIPLRFEFRIAVLTLGGTYVACLVAITPNGILLMLVFLLTFIPMAMPAITLVVRHFRKRRPPALPTTN